jgi:3-oxoadipate enol-lactonase
MSFTTDPAPGAPALRWREGGARSSEAVVLLHSLGTDSRLWHEQATALCADHRVLMPDARGHGSSEWAEPLTVEAWVDDLERVLEAAEVEHAVVVGLSMGGVQALAYALEHPRRVQGLVLADTFAELDPAIAAAKVEQLAGVATRDGMATLADNYVAETFTGPVGADRVALVRDAIAGMTAATYIASAEVTFGARLADRLQHVEAPTLVLWGTRDAKTPRALSEQLAAGIEGAALVEIPDAGHLSNLESPRAFTEAVAAFADAPGRATAALRAAGS